MTNKKMYNISAGKSFVDVLAERYLDEFAGNPDGLAKALFLMPNRRACQSLADAFVRKHNLKPTILPQIKPIAEVDEDEVFLTNDSAILQDLLPAVDSTEKVLQFTKLIMKKSELGLDKMSLAQAYALAQNLSALMDMSYNEQLDLQTIKNLVGEEYANHWKQTLLLLQIITENWPKILAENGKVDAMQRRNLLLEAEIKLWRRNQTEQRIVVAGTTAAFPLMKKLVQTVLNLPNGEVYLYGLDKYLEDSAWEKIDENHPQYELKELLEYLRISRDSVIDIGSNLPFTTREKIVAETMRPAETSAAWRDLSAHPLTEADFKDIRLVNCDDLRQEAAAIALIIRHTLEEPEKTAALVTMDRELSRRVVSELQRWKINADDSAGKPLALTPVGIYLRLICRYVEETTDTAMMTLMKHPFTNCGLSKEKFNENMRQLEYALRKGWKLTPSLQAFVDDFQRRIQPLYDLYQQPCVELSDIFETHLKAAESLADTDSKKGGQIIWRGDAGSVAAEWVSDFLEKSKMLGTVNINDYSGLLTVMLAEQSVRKRYGTHPRVKILGPIEARLTQYDVTIIGEANEGVWPNQPAADMWMSRPMKKEYGLPLPERQIGVSAADFAHLLNAPKVYMTRAKKHGKDPTDKSRWWLRFETILEAIFGPEEDAFAFIYDQPYAYWAKYMDRRGGYHPIKAPAPCPEVKRRPTEMAVTKIDKWMRNPYDIYAQYILKLYRIDELDAEQKPYDYGNIVHDVLKEFNDINAGDSYPTPEEALAQLSAIGRREFADREVPQEVSAFWWPRFVKQMEWVIKQEQDYRPFIRQLQNETFGEVILPSPSGGFRIFGTADRVEILKNGTLNIVDYKTGNDSFANKEITAGKAPQLPVEAIIAQKGGFEGVPAAKVSALRYWALKEETIKEAVGKDCEKAIGRITEIVENLINAYARQEQPYLVKPRPSDMGKISDYDHLSRLNEWCVHAEQKED